MDNVTLKQLRAFLALAKERSFTRAAGQLNVSQSALTLQIRALESEVGVRLFNRSTRSVELTPQGVGFFPMVERIMEQLSLALSNVQTTADRARGSVAVAAGSSVISLVIAPSVVRLEAAYPGISVRIIEHAGKDLASRVIKGEADFGIAALTSPADSLDAQLVLKDRFGVLCARHHPLSMRTGRLCWSNLAGHAFVALARGTDTREMLDSHPAVRPHLPNPIYEVASLSALFSLVESGAGFTLLPGIAAWPAIRHNLIFRPIFRPSMERALYFIHDRRRSLTPAAGQLAGTIIDELKKLKKKPKLDSLMEIAGGLADFRRQFDDPGDETASAHR